MRLPRLGFHGWIYLWVDVGVTVIILSAFSYRKGRKRVVGCEGLAGCSALLRFFSCLGLRGRLRGTWGIRRGRFPVAYVCLVCLVFLPSSSFSLASRLQFRILDILP